MEFQGKRLQDVRYDKNTPANLARMGSETTRSSLRIMKLSELQKCFIARNLKFWRKKKPV
jgi:hypothetical protein